jgi:hypothetical protein
MVHITPTINEGVSQLHCDVDWWGDEVSSDQAVELAADHEASVEHREADVDDMLFELLAEAIRDERGY